jgi:hypothetical protein
MRKEVELYITKNYYELLTIAKKITKGNQLSQELLHECIIQLYDKEQIILEKYTDSQIKYYIVAIMRTNWFSNTSPFYYRIRRESAKYVDLKEVLEMEAEIKRSGKWNEYEKQMLNNNKNAIVNDFELSVEEFYKINTESYVTEQGDIESWNGGKINEEEIKNVKDYIKKLREHEL